MSSTSRFGGPSFWFHFLVVPVLLVGIQTTAARGQGLLDLFSPRVSKVDEELVSGSASEQSKVVLIQIHGVIMSSSRGALVDRTANPERLRWQVEKASSDPGVKGVIVEINSPGGEVTASDVMYDQLNALKVDHKRVVALLGSVAASGGYYVAAAADRIVAHPTTITGSLGVLMHAPHVVGLFEKLGLKVTVLKSARTPMKDIFSPTREMTPEEQKLIQSMLDKMYDRFVSIIAKGRKMTEAKVRELADGRIYLGPEAKDNGLVDSIGYRQDAFDQVLKLAGIKSAKLVRYKKPVNLMESLSGVENRLGGLLGVTHDPELLLDLAVPRFMYLAPLGH